MIKHLNNAANTLERGRIKSFISRVAWNDLEELVRSTYNELDGLKKQKDELGSIYLTSNLQYPPFNENNFRCSNIKNQIQISTGWRLLNVSGANYEDKGSPKAELLAESSATLWYSQDITGSVCVFVAPYTSKAMSMNEKDIVIARYGCPTKISKKLVENHFSTYFKYCAATSCHGNLGLSGYIFRLYLKYNDFRSASIVRGKIFSYAEALLGIVGIIATLYAGNKIFT